MAVSKLQTTATSTLPNWTQISNVTASGTAVNFTGLGSYKYYRVVATGLKTTVSAAFRLRINNNAGGVYNFYGMAWQSAASGYTGSTDSTGPVVGAYNTASLVGSSFDMTVENLSSSSGVKVINGSYYYNDGGVFIADNLTALVVETGITQINLITQSGTFNAGTITLYGTN